MTVKLRERRPVEPVLGDADRAALLRLVSLLLQYPDAELLEARAELARAAADLPDGPSRAALVEFTAWFAATDPMECARHYVTTFDLRRRSSLYLTYYLHGDTRRRGMAMLTLKQRFRAAGLTPPADELPDYLPVVCEFAALAGPGGGEAPLRQHRRGLELVRTALRDADSPYVRVMDALCAALPPLSDTDRDAVAELAAAGPPAEDVGLAPFGPAGHLTGSPLMTNEETCR